MVDIPLVDASIIDIHAQMSLEEVSQADRVEQRDNLQWSIMSFTHADFEHRLDGYATVVAEPDIVGIRSVIFPLRFAHNSVAIEDFVALRIRAFML